MQPAVEVAPPSGGQQGRSYRGTKDPQETGIAFLSSCHRRLQQLSAAEAAAASGKPPVLCGCVTLRPRPSIGERSPGGGQEQPKGDEDPEFARERGTEGPEDDRMKQLLYSFNYDGRFAATVAALAAGQPLAFLGAAGLSSRETFVSLVSQIKLLHGVPTTTSTAYVQRKEARKGAALLAAVRDICCCDVAEEAAKAPGCAVLAAAFGDAPGASAAPPQDLAAAQERLQGWQRESADLLVEALELLWGDLLNIQR